MNPKLIFAALGAVLVPAVAVPASISLTPTNQEALVESSEVKAPQAPQAPQTTTKTSVLKNYSSLKGFSKKSSEGDEGYYISKYQEYFLDHSKNQGLWEEKFNRSEGSSSGRIYIFSYEDDDEDETRSLAVTISKPWDTNHHDSQYETNMTFPLNVFCGQWYQEGGWKQNNVWTFYPSSSSSFSGIDASYLWKLCSAFEFKPKTIDEDRGQLQNLYSNPSHIGNKLKISLVSINNNDEFWELRQKEWKELASYDSTYFTYQEGKLIKELCGFAYNKEPAPNQDSTDAPTLDNARKYCSLEWDF